MAGRMTAWWTARSTQVDRPLVAMLNEHRCSCRRRGGGGSNRTRKIRLALSGHRKETDGEPHCPAQHWLRDFNKTPRRPTAQISARRSLALGRRKTDAWTSARVAQPKDHSIASLTGDEEEKEDALGGRRESQSTKTEAKGPAHRIAMPQPAVSPSAFVCAGEETLREHDEDDQGLPNQLSPHFHSSGPRSSKNNK